MIVAGQRVESLNCGWVVALEDAPVKRGTYVPVKFENTGNVKNVLTPGFATGNMRDTDAPFAEGDVLKSTTDGNFKILKIQGSRNITVQFFDTGNIVEGLQKDAAICGYVKDQVLKEDIQHTNYLEQVAREQARYAAQERAEEAKRLQAERRKAWRESVAKNRADKEKRIKDYLDNKVARDAELRQNALKAVTDLDSVSLKGENPNDVNVDFKDRDGNWVLHFGWKDKFYHTRLGRYYNNMTQRAGKNNGYEDVTVSDDFLDAQKFCDWAVQQPGWGEGYCLEKDLLVVGNRHYSPETCCFVPHVVNTAIIHKTGKSVATEKADGWHVKLMKNYLNIFLGVYPSKGAALRAYAEYREEYVKKLAEFFQNKISDRAYQALLSWKTC